MVGSNEIIMIFAVFMFWIPIIVIAYLLIKYLINRNKTSSGKGKSDWISQKKDILKVKLQKRNLKK